MRRTPAAETICDGLRTVGHIVPRGSDYEVFLGDTYVCKGPTLADARAAVRRADVDRFAPAQLEDDSGAPA